MAQTSLKPGVVTGEEYKALVAACKEGGYALPAVNVTGTNTVNTDEICAAIKDVFEDTRSIPEPSGALSVAGMKK